MPCPSLFLYVTECGRHEPPISDTHPKKRRGYMCPLAKKVPQRHEESAHLWAFASENGDNTRVAACETGVLRIYTHTKRG